MRIFDNLNFSGETDLDTRFARFDFATLCDEIEELKYLTPFLPKISVETS